MRPYPVKLPEGLETKIKEAAEKADMLPTEYIRQVLRDHFNSPLPVDGT